MEEDARQHGDIEPAEIARQGVDVAIYDLAAGSKLRVRVPPAVVHPLEVGDAQAPVGLEVVAYLGKNVGSDALREFEGHDVSAPFLHVAGHVAGGGPDLEHPLIRNIDPAQIAALPSPQIPHPRNHIALPKIHGVVEVALLATNVAETVL
jgi:hypothetical protein